MIYTVLSCLRAVIKMEICDVKLVENEFTVTSINIYLIPSENDFQIFPSVNSVNNDCKKSWPFDVVTSFVNQFSIEYCQWPIIIDNNDHKW